MVFTIQKNDPVLWFNFRPILNMCRMIEDKKSQLSDIVDYNNRPDTQNGLVPSLMVFLRKYSHKHRRNNYKTFFDNIVKGLVQAQELPKQKLRFNPPSRLGQSTTANTIIPKKSQDETLNNLMSKNPILGEFTKNKKDNIKKITIGTSTFYIFDND